MNRREKRAKKAARRAQDEREAARRQRSEVRARHLTGAAIARRCKEQARLLRTKRRPSRWLYVDPEAITFARDFDYKVSEYIRSIVVTVGDTILPAAFGPLALAPAAT